ncbi:unnamed protein product [Sphacelaria rigidula]
MDSFAPFGWLRTIPRTVAMGALLLFRGAANAQTVACPAYGTAGQCEAAFNIPECDYSDGNCCWCDCEPVEYCKDQGDASYNCINPDSACYEEPTIDETPAPIVVVETPVVTDEDDFWGNDDVEDAGQPVATDDDDYRVNDDVETALTPAPVTAATTEPSLGDSTTATTPSPSVCSDQNVGDGYCDEENNNEPCLWDGGDCCECTCDAEATYKCGSPEYDCKDPRGTTCEDLEDATGSSSPSFYNANFLFALGVSCAMVFSMVATPNYN